MSFEEFWKEYHREDAKEALEHPHELVIHLKDGSKHNAFFPGSLLAASNWLSIGIGFKKDGSHKSNIFVDWSDIQRIEPIKASATVQRRKIRTVA